MPRPYLAKIDAPSLARDCRPLIETPCLKVCVLEPGSKLCRGCGRTIEEIAGWGTMPERERRRIMALLPGRIAAARSGMGERAGQTLKD